MDSRFAVLCALPQNASCHNGAIFLINLTPTHFMKKIAKQWANALLAKFNLKLVSGHRGYLTGSDLEHDLALLIDQPSPICIDVGANVGQTIEMFSRTLLQPVIHAFEPSTKTFSELESNVSSMPNVYLHRMGVGSEAGTRRFKNLSNSQLSSFLTPADLPWLPEGEFEQLVYEEEVLDVVKLDEFFEQQSISEVDILKSDTQGFELEVLLGAEQALKKGNVKLVLVEMNFFEMYSEQVSYREIFTLLESYDYYLVDLYEKARSKKHNGTLSWCTALFAKRNQSRWADLIRDY